MAKKKQLPVWAQMALVWFVMSTLSAFGLLYLRASDTIGDGIFQPVASVLCSAGDRLETTYVQKTVRVDSSGRSVGTDARQGRQQQVFSLDAATCRATDGSSRAAAAFEPIVWSVFAIGFGVLFFVGWMRQPR